MRANRVRIGVLALAAMWLLAALPVVAEQPATHDLTQQFLKAGVSVDGFRAIEVGGIVVLRGTVADRIAAESASSVAQSLGYTRVANLIQVSYGPDDARIKRDAERELASFRGLDGTEIEVSSTKGVVSLRGKVLSELQKDMAVSLVKTVDGVRSVQVSLAK